MAINIKQTAEEATILVTNGASNRAAGKLIAWGGTGRVVLLKNDQLANDVLCPAWFEEIIFEYAKLSTDVVADGDKLYFDATNDRLTKTATNNTFAGVAVGAAGNGVATVRCLLNFSNGTN